MRIAAFGAGVVASLMVAAMVAAMAPQIGFAQRTAPPAATPGQGLIALATAAGEQRQQITVIDPDTRSMSVYHVELASGQISLCSVRNIHWDLQMTVHNGKAPLPNEIRAMLEQP
jgi:hypothetical protein